MSEYTTAGFGATINGKHTWKDYGLVIGNTDIVSEPSPKTNYIEVPGSSKLLEGSGIPVVPAFLVSNLDESVSNYITFNGTRYTLQEGRNRFADLIIPAGGGRLYFYGKYTVNIEFRGGSL